MNPNESYSLPPLTMKEFIQRLCIVAGIVTTFLALAYIVTWLTPPAIAGN